MRRLTVREVNEQHDGVLPPDATYRPDDGEELARPAPPAKPKPRAGRSERFAVLNAFVDFGIAAAGLKPAAALVWFVLFRDTKANGTARTSQADIARRTGLSARGVKLAVRQLREKGLVRVVQRGRLNVGPSVYAVLSAGSHGAT